MREKTSILIINCVAPFSFKSTIKQPPYATHVTPKHGLLKCASIHPCDAMQLPNTSFLHTSTLHQYLFYILSPFPFLFPDFDPDSSTVHASTHLEAAADSAITDLGVIPATTSTDEHTTSFKSAAGALVRIKHDDGAGVTLSKDGFFLNSSRFFYPVGVNYWPASTGCNLWTAEPFPSAEIQHDLDVLAASPFNSLRIFLEWGRWLRRGEVCEPGADAGLDQTEGGWWWMLARSWARCRVVTTGRAGRRGATCTPTQR